MPTTTTTTTTPPSSPSEDPLQPPPPSHVVPPLPSPPPPPPSPLPASPETEIAEDGEDSHVVPPLPSSSPAPPPPPASPETEIAEGEDIRITLPVIQTEVETELNWPNVTTCIASVLLIAFQIRYPWSPTIVLSGIAFSLSLLSTIVDYSISPSFPTLRQLMSALAIFFLVDGFLLVITMRLSIILKSIIWALYFLVCVLVLVSKWLKIRNH